MKRILAAFAAAVALSVVAAPVLAQQFPNKPVRILTPFPSGSGPDAVLRLVGDKLSRTWGQQVLVDNRPGANGAIAIEAAKKAPADGYTLVQMDDTHMAMQPHLYKQLSYDIQKDFDPVATLFRTYFFVVVPADAPWKGVGDLVADARAKKGELTYGSWFVGSPGHVGAAMLESATGTNMTHIPFKEMTQLYAAVGNKDVAWAFGTAASSGGMYRAKKVKYLAVAAPQRIAGFGDVPTVAEAGGPANFEVKAWVALFAPRGTPADIVAKLNADIARVLAEPDVKERLAGFAFEPLSLATAEITRQIQLDSKRYGDVIRKANISID
jgi:tripartite-type tricarboxylate transporter receptor subunit TctC